MQQILVYIVFTIALELSSGRTIQRSMLGIVQYLFPVLTNFYIISYQNQIYINIFTEDVYQIYLDVSHHCPLVVHLWRHTNEHSLQKKKIKILSFSVLFCLWYNGSMYIPSSLGAFFFTFLHWKCITLNYSMHADQI